MKRLFKFTLLLFLLSLCACKDRSYPRLLVTADSLTYCKPDSAISLLKQLGAQMNTEPETTQMYYKLLQIKANDKAYITHTSDSAILHIVRYYEKKKDKAHLMEAYYYAGRVYCDLNDAPQALEYFQKAIQASHSNTDYRLISKIYAQIGDLFSYQDIYDEALGAFRKAYPYSVMAKDSSGMVFALRDIAGAYRDNKLIPYSLHYYQKAFNLAQTIHNQFLMDLIQNQMASLYIQQKKYDLARKALHPSLNNIQGHNKSGIYSIASKLYHQTGQIDSATYYYKEILSCGTIYAKQAAQRGLAEIAMQEKRPQEALEHLDCYLLCTDSIEKLHDAEAIRKAQALYNYQLREKENIRLKAENGRQRLWILYSGIALLFLFTAFILYRERSRRKSLQLKIQLEKVETLRKESYQQSQQTLEKNKEQINELAGQIKAFQEKNGLQVKLLLAQKEQIEKSNALIKARQEKQKTEEAAFYESEIYIYFRDSLHETHPKITQEQWKTLQTAINNVYTDFTQRLLRLHSFNEFELHICLLLKIHFPTTSIANFTAHTKSAVVSARKRMFEKVFLKAGKPEEWDAFVRSL